MTTPDRIIDLLDRHPEGLTDTEIAHILNLPKPSVRRTRSLLETNQRVFYLNSDGAFRSNRYNTVKPELPSFNADEAQA